MNNEQPGNQTAKTKNSNALSIKLDFRFLSVLLLFVIIGMLAVWRPWNAQTAGTARKLTVTGEVTLKAEPDEFVFYPSYQSTNADRTKAIAELADKSTAIVTKLKELGVSEDKITTSTNSYDQIEYYPKPAGGESPKATLSLSVAVGGKEMAQKVQDYLLTTNPTGQISPQGQFSTEKRKTLGEEARAKATDDAKNKASKQASQLEVKLGKVIEVKDGDGFGIIAPMTAEASMRDMSVSSSLPVQPGQNDYSFSVSVTYELK